MSNKASSARTIPTLPLPEPAVKADADPDEIRIGISACLLGYEVRFDAGHKLDRFVRDTVGRLVRFVPVCPELELGLGTPRETLQLVGAENGPRLVTTKTRRDLTEPMQRWAATRLEALQGLDLSGFILKKDSPSCGMQRVRVYREGGGPPAREGAGIFAAALMQHFPLLPIEEEGRLHDMPLRENFFERVFAYRRARKLFDGRWRLADLIAFHSREKLLLLAHDRPIYDQLGQLVAGAKAQSRAEVAATYQALFMRALSRIATTRKHCNVLQHITGHLRKVLDAPDRQELQEVLAQYRAQWIPLIVPITLVRHHVHRHGLGYLAQQSYLEPHPRELMLRNHV